MVAKDVGQTRVGRCLALFGSLGQRAFAHSHPRIGMSQRSVDRTVSSSCFLLKKDPMVLSELVEFGPRISAETVKACALIGVRTMAEEKCPSVEQ